MLTTAQADAIARQRETVVLFAGAHVSLHKEVRKFLNYPM